MKAKVQKETNPTAKQIKEVERALCGKVIESDKYIGKRNKKSFTEYYFRVESGDLLINYYSIAELAKSFKTKNINFGNWSYIDGCPTCNYNDIFVVSVTIIKE